MLKPHYRWDYLAQAWLLCEEFSPCMYPPRLS